MKIIARIERVCMACRYSYCIEKLIRLTVDPLSFKIVLNGPKRAKPGVNGRSAYICCSAKCINSAIQGNRLKYALTGRKLKSEKVKRNIFWPLESQLIKDMYSICAEQEKTCQNTKVKEA